MCGSRVYLHFRSLHKTKIETKIYVSLFAHGLVCQVKSGTSLSLSSAETPFGNLWALSYNATKDLVFDAGFDRGLTNTSTQWEVFAGFTYLVPHRMFRH
jgi:hypothetical protein